MRNVALTILIVFALVFGVQNMHPVNLVFIVWSVSTVTSVAIVVALVLGILIGMLLLLPALLRRQRETRESRKLAAAMENSLNQRHADNLQVSKGNLPAYDKNPTNDAE